MKIAVIIILIILAYGIIGYAFAACWAAYWDDRLEFSEDDTFYIFIGVGWILIMPFVLIFLISRFVGKKLAIIPIAIIALTKVKKDERGEQGE